MLKIYGFTTIWRFLINERQDGGYKFFLINNNNNKNNNNNNIQRLGRPKTHKRYLTRRKSFFIGVWTTVDNVK